MSAPNLFSIWEKCLEDRKEDPFVRIARSSATRVQQYSFTAFHKRASRAAVAFEKVLGLTPGSRIAICTDDLDELALLIHGALLADLVVVPLHPRMNSSELKEVLSDASPEVLIFPPSFTATIASLIGSVPSIRHWVVTGRRADGRERGAIQVLESVLLSIAGEELRSIPMKHGGIECSGAGYGSASSRGKHFVGTEEFLRRVQIASECLSPAPSDGNIWMSFPEESLPGILHNFFLPLFYERPVLVRPLSDMKDFWRQMVADDVRLALVSYDEFLQIHKKGKARDWRKSDDFMLYLCDEERIDSQLYEEFIDRFMTDIGVSFFLRNEARYISYRHPTYQELEFMEDETGQTLISHGTAIAKLDVVDNDGRAYSEPEQWGELVIRSDSDSGGDLSTGIRTALLSFQGGKEYELFVAGRSSELITRDGKVISIARTNQLLSQMKGVVFGKAVPFPHPSKGTDFSVYVIPHRLAQLNKFDVEIYLAENLEPEERPTEVVMAKEGQVKVPKTDEELYNLLFE